MKHCLARCRGFAALVVVLLGLAVPDLPAQVPSVGLLREIYTGIPGNSVAELTSHPSFPDRPTRRTYVTDVVETPLDEAEQYGQRLRGFLSPPASGDYVFWIASDDQSMLYLSPDEDPERRRLIAGVNSNTGYRDWFSEPNQQSSPIALEAGRYYYFEALMKEGVGGDHLSIRWMMPGGILEEPMSAAYLVPYGTPLFGPDIRRQPASVTVVEGEAAIFRVEVRNADPVNYQWQRNGTALRGEVRSTLTLNRVSMADHDARFRCLLANALGVVLSEEAVLRVLPDQVPPGVAAVFNLSPTNVLVRFTEPVGTNTAFTSTHYALDGGVSVAAARAGGSSAEVILTTSPLASGTTYTLTVNRVTDRAASPNAVPPDTRATFVALGLVPATLGRLPVEPVVEAADGGLNITAVSAGLRGTSDQAHFSQQVRTGDFDVELRVASLQGANLFAQAGLMARQSLSEGSVFAAALASPGLAGSSFRWRASTGTVAQASGSFPANYPETWLRLRREGTNFTGFAGDDGVTWTSLGRVGIAMSNAVYLGVVLAGHGTNAPVSGQFRDFRDFEPREPVVGMPSGVEPPGPSSRRTSLVFSEILYHAPDRPDGRRLEYVEIFNADSVDVELSGYRVSGDVDYPFPDGTVLRAGGYLLVAESPDDLRLARDLDASVTVLGPWDGRLPRDLGTLRLRNRAGAVLLEVTYSDDPPWPASAAGAGHSLVLARPSFGEGDVRAWAASERRGGSPGNADVRRSNPWRHVRINEVLAHTDEPVVDYLELFNASSAPVDLSGCILTDNPDEARYRIPTGTLLAGGGHVAWSQDDLGFALSAAGESVYLIEPGGERVIDAIRFGPQLNGVSSGRTPDGSDDWRPQATPTPGTPNAPRRQSDVVINEIQYHPPSGESAEFVELLNRGTAPVSLLGWRLVGGVDYAVTNAIVLPPGGFVVVAADAARLRTIHPGLASGQVVGNFSGSLRDRGEWIGLSRPETMVTTNAQGVAVSSVAHVLVDEVDYRDGGRWGRWADGGGSSLERRHPDADGRRAASWADSDETARSEWMEVAVTGLLELGEGAPDELHVMLLGGGECLIDDVQVLNEGGANLVSNPGFEGGMSGWIAQGNHVTSGLATSGFSGRRSLHLRASAGGDNGANLVKADLATGGLAVNGYATIRAKVRWLHGHPDLLIRLKGNYLETTATLIRPDGTGTPGADNSRRIANPGPAIWDVQHFPVVPQAQEPVRVMARIEDPNGVGTVRLRLRYDPSVTVHNIPMSDNGRDGDGLAGDGIFTATIPGQAVGVLVAFWIEASDRATPAAMATFPEIPADRECLVRFGDAIPAGTFGAYRLWMTQKQTDIWSSREVMSNEALDGTVVYGTVRAIYNGGARYRGSPFIRPNYNTPTGSLSAYVWTLPKDDRLLGSDEFNLDWLEQPGRDPSLQRERLSFWVGEQLGVSTSHTRYIKVYVNGVRRGEVYTDSQQPNGDYVSSWFPNRDEGEIFKIDDWFEFNDAVQREFNVDATLEPFRNSAGQLHRTRYRWNWEKKSNRDLNDDYSSLMTLLETLNSTGDDEYASQVAEVIDPDGWLRPIAARRAVADWDGYGYSRGKNTFAYLPPGGRWNLLLWDLDFSLGGGSDGPMTGVFSADDPTMERMYADPYFGRVYLQALSDVARGPFAAGRADPVMDGNYAALRGNDVTATAPTDIRSWIAARRTFLLQVLATNSAPWSVDAEPTGGWPMDRGFARISGTAPIQVRTISVNGSVFTPEWSTRTNWFLQVPVRSGTNLLSFSGLDLRGDHVPGAAGVLQLVNPAPEEPAGDHVRITEVHYEPADPDAEFIELHNSAERTAYDLSRWRLEGVDFVFPEGTTLPAGGYLVAVKDRLVFESVFGRGHPVVGEYPGRLNNAGEALRLVRPGSVSEPQAVINAVAYSPRAPWPERAAGAGGSLQVVDASRDNRRPSNWYAVDAAGHGHARWQFASATGRAVAATDSILIALPPGSGAHVDDVSLVAGVVPRVGPEWVQNGGFEEGLAVGWTLEGGMSGSSLDVAEHRSGRSSVRLVSAAGAPSGTSYLRQTLGRPLVPGQTYTLSYWYLPDRQGGELTIRLGGGGIGASVDAREVAVAVATPGAPSSASHVLPEFPEIWINEVLPPGPGGAGWSWIELYNASDADVNLSGWFLSSDPRWLGQWAFPAGARLAQRDFLVVQTGGGPPMAGALQGGFPLVAGSGSVVLSRTSEGVPAAVDVLSYEDGVVGRSLGSYPDGAWTERRIFEVPTPGEPNDVSSLQVRLAINEWMSRNNSTIVDPADGDYDDWFEIYNGGAETVDLTGYTLTDTLAEPRRSVIPAGFSLAPGGVLLIWADGEPDQTVPGTSLHVDFALSADGETLALFSPGGSLVDLVEFEAQGRDVSHGLVPDGAYGSVQRQRVPSPGVPNAAPPAAEIRITGIAVDSAGIRMSWTTLAGRGYQVQFTEDLRLGWINVGSPLIATGSTVDFLDQTAAAAGLRFYRVIGLP